MENEGCRKVETGDEIKKKREKNMGGEGRTPLVFSNIPVLFFYKEALIPIDGH